MFKKLVLKNGLTVILDQNKKMHHTKASIYVKVGGRDTCFTVDGKEYNMNCGIAHLLEHYLLEQSIYGNICENFSREFIKTNGATSINETFYYLNTVHHFKRNLIKLLNVVNRPDFNSEKLFLVKKPIIQEIRMSFNEIGKLFENSVIDSVFETKINDVILGDERSLDEISIEGLKFFHETFYRPENQIITISGNVDDDIIGIIEKEYQRFEFKNNKVKRSEIVETRNVISKLNVVHDKTIPEKLLQNNYKIDLSELTPLERNKIDYYSDYLYYSNYSKQSEFYNNLIEGKLVMMPINTRFRPNLVKNKIVFSLTVYTENFDKVIKLMENQINNLQVSSDSFVRWKNRFIIRGINQYEKPDYKVDNFVSNLLLYDLEQYDTLEFIENLNLDEYQNLIKNIDFSNYSIVINDNEDTY